MRWSGHRCIISLVLAAVSIKKALSGYPARGISVWDFPKYVISSQRVQPRYVEVHDC